MEEKIEKVKEFAEKLLKDNKCSAHNMDHVMRVYNNALLLAKDENVDMEVIRIAALLHDIGSIKEYESSTFDHAIEGAKLAEPFLEKLKLPKDKIQHILDCIVSHRYRTDQKPKTEEAKIIFDADKLETIGAIGIARVFVWIGRNNAHIYKKVNLDEYAKENLGGKMNGRIQDRSKHSPQINWETKDKFVLDFLYTKKAKQIARKRYTFSEKFLDKLEREIEGLE